MPNVRFWLALPRLFSLHKICNLLLCCFCESTFLFMPREFRCLQGRFRGLCFASWRCDETAGSWLSLPETVCVGACYAMLCYAVDSAMSARYMYVCTHLCRIYLLSSLCLLLSIKFSSIVNMWVKWGACPAIMTLPFLTGAGCPTSLVTSTEKPLYSIQPHQALASSSFVSSEQLKPL